MSHAEAYAILRATAPRDASGLKVGPRATRLAQAVALHESGYGSGWSRSCPEAAGSHNWGAIQGSPGVICSDTHADGTPYTAPYRVYASDEAGAAGLWHELWRRAPVRRVLMDDALDVSGLARAMHQTGYFEATERSYTKALRNALARILA